MIRRIRALWWHSSFVEQITVMFLSIWLIPMLLLSIVNQSVTMAEMNKKIIALASVSLKQASQNINSRLKSYEQTLLQLTYSDAFVAEMEKFNSAISEQSIATSRTSLVRSMRVFALSHDYVRNILFATQKGCCAYDRSVESINDAYLRNFPASITGTQIVGYDYPHWLPTRYLYTPAKEPHYVLTLRIKADNIYNRHSYGMMVMSVDVSMLKEVCGYSLVSDDPANHFITILDADGGIVYHHDVSLYGKNASAFLDADTLDDVLSERSQGETTPARIDAQEYLLSVATVPQTGWRIVSALSQNYLSHEVRISRRIFSSVILVQFLLLLGTLLLITRTLSSFTTRLIRTMDTAPDSNFSVRIDATGQNEISMIADHFNAMMETINRLMIDLENQTEKVRQVTQKGKEAELRALEAQINPHFLYNTLDSINWMAIENNQYEISDMLGTLANLFRYSIQYSNKMVRIGEEADYLVNYLRIQQYRYSNSFDYLLDISAEVRGYYTYKLLFQPLVENVLLHGFSGRTRSGLITIAFRQVSNERICFALDDNGKGMTQEAAQDLFHGDSGAGIGIANVLSRLRLYYADRCDIQVSAAPGKGLSIRVFFPLLRETREEANHA